MKLSGYHKERGDSVNLLLSYDNISHFDQVYISKVFTDTQIPQGNTFLKNPLEQPNVKYGGTGFFFDKAQPLPYEIEHHMPDYHLYDRFIQAKEKEGMKSEKMRFFRNFSIGFATRGCFRKCKFCVNKKYDRPEKNSRISEFLNPKYENITLLDDNILAYARWEEVFDELADIGKPFQFNQGMDIRSLKPEKAKALSESKYWKDYNFAFDDIADKETIEKNLRLWKKSSDRKKTTKFYVLCGYDRNDKYDLAFWKKDLQETFERLEFLMKNKCLPFLMRYEKCYDSYYSPVYRQLAQWTNHPPLFLKQSFKERLESPKNKKARSVYERVAREIPELKKYFDMKWDTVTS
jgi:hypothetical protein